MSGEGVLRRGCVEEQLKVGALLSMGVLRGGPMAACWSSQGCRRAGVHLSGDQRHGLREQHGAVRGGRL